MRLLFVCPDMRTGGTERHWATLIPELHDRGETVRLVTLAETGAFFDDVVARGVPAECLALRRRTDPRGLRRALSIAAAFEPDAVVSRGVSGQLVGEAIARRSRRGRGDGAVHVVNEHTPLTPDGRLVAPRPHQRVLTRVVSRAVDAVVAVTRRQVPPLEALGYPSGRIDVVPNGLFERHVQGVEPSRDLDPDGFAVLCVAGLRPEKRVDLFIEAVAAARRETASIRGYVAGEGPERERLERLASGSGVTLLGVRPDALELIRAADALCLPSEAEALPMSILEAMALARPVVTTDVGGTRDQVIDGETGYVTPPGDAAALAHALLELASDRRRAEAMGVAGRVRQRERFTGAAMVDGYEDALERAVSRGQA
jgi:glycosyltransferase involved in cell wall biosynthesis